MASATVLRGDGEATRLRILRAAERLFAERGVDGVSLQAIGRAADQKHRSAVRYHFGDRLDLLREILARHAGAIADERNALIDAIESEGAAHDLLRIAEAWVLPVLRKAEEDEGGMDFVRISAELIGHPRYSGFYFSRGDELLASRRLRALVAGACPKVPREYRRPRTIAFAGFLFHAVADWSNASEGLGADRRRREWRALKRYLVEATAAQWQIRPWDASARR